MLGSCLSEPDGDRVRERGLKPQGQPLEGGLNKQLPARERGDSQSLPLSHIHSAGRRGGGEEADMGELVLGLVLCQPPYISHG